jgi:hypothetical protein
LADAWDVDYASGTRDKGGKTAKVQGLVGPAGAGTEGEIGETEDVGNGEVDEDVEEPDEQEDVEEVDGDQELDDDEEAEEGEEDVEEVEDEEGADDADADASSVAGSGDENS